MAAFDVEDLRARGFQGFATVGQLADDIAVVPPGPGLYAVALQTGETPVFLEQSPASWFKGKDPTVPVQRLAREWVPDAETLYIGSSIGLRDRIELLIRFSNAGRGASVFHWGGRLLWQLGNAQDLLVSWLSTSSGIGSAERDLVDEFVAAYGRLPFANLKRPPVR